jgi:hypothetical protein
MFVLDLILCLAVVVMVVSPLAWAIHASRAADSADAVRAARARSRFRLGQAQAQRARGRTRIDPSIRPVA